MNAKQIRGHLDSIPSGSHNVELVEATRGAKDWLREIAAQLAEFNETIGGVSEDQMPILQLVPAVIRIEIPALDRFVTFLESQEQEEVDQHVADLRQANQRSKQASDRIREAISSIEN